jgi:hypothetical protein
MKGQELDRSGNIAIIDMVQFKYQAETLTLPI